MLESVARAEDIVKVYEARLTEKETTSLSPGEVDDYILTLKVHFNTFFHTYITIFLPFLLDHCTLYLASRSWYRI